MPTTPLAPTFDSTAQSIKIPSVSHVRYHIYVADQAGVATSTEVFYNGDASLGYAKSNSTFTKATGLPVGGEPSVFVVEAESADPLKYPLAGVTRWVQRFAGSNAELAPLSATAPTFDPVAAKIVIPAVSGVRYHIYPLLADGTIDVSGEIFYTGRTETYAVPGTYTASTGLKLGPTPSTYVVRAEVVDSKKNYLDGEAQWHVTLPALADSRVAQKVSVAPSFDDVKQLIVIPSVAGVRFHIYVADANGQPQLDQEIFYDGDASVGFAKPSANYSVAHGLRLGLTPTSYVVMAEPVDATKNALVGPTTWQHTFGPQLNSPVALPVTAEPSFFADPRIAIPSLAGVRFHIYRATADGVPIENGEIFYDGDATLGYAKPSSNYSLAHGLVVPDGEVSTYVVTAEPASPTKNFLTGAIKWSYTFVGVGAQRTSTDVTPTGPTFSSAPSKLVIPADQGVRYRIYLGDPANPQTKQLVYPDSGLDYAKPATYSTAQGLPDGGLVTVVASSANANVNVLQGQTRWTYVFKPAARTSLDTVAPTFTDAPMKLQIPAVSGVRYRIYLGDPASPTSEPITYPGSGLDYAKPATYTVNEGLREGREIFVVASPVSSAKNVLNGATQWVHKFPPTNKSQLAAPAPTIDGSALNVKIPSLGGVRFELYISSDVDNPYAKLVVHPGATSTVSNSTYTKSDGLTTGSRITVVARTVNDAVNALTGASEWTTFVKTPLPEETASAAPVFDDTALTVKIPSVNGAQYHLYLEDESGNPKGIEIARAGDTAVRGNSTYTVADGLKPGVAMLVTVETREGASNVITGETQWSHTFPTSTASEVVPAAPTFDFTTQQLRINGTSGVQYHIYEGLDTNAAAREILYPGKEDLGYAVPGTYTPSNGGLPIGKLVTVVAKAGNPLKTKLKGETRWYAIFAPTTVGELTALAPTFDDATPYIRIPSVSGLQYHIRPLDAAGNPTGEEIFYSGDASLGYAKPGTYDIPRGLKINAFGATSYLVEAVAASSKQRLSGERAWVHTFARPATSLTAPSPVPNNQRHTLRIPAQAGVRYYIYNGNPSDGAAQLVSYPGSNLDYSKPAEYGYLQGLPLGVPLTVVARVSRPGVERLDGATQWQFVIAEREVIELSAANDTVPVFYPEKPQLRIPGSPGVRFHVYVGDPSEGKEIFFPGKDPLSNPAFDYAAPGLYTHEVGGLPYGKKITVVATLISENQHELKGQSVFVFQMPNRIEGDLLNGDEFKGGLTDDWTVKVSQFGTSDPTKTSTDALSNSWYAWDSAEVTDGVEGAEDGSALKITTMRHCIDEASGEEPNAANAQEEPCPAGKRTIYTTSRLESPYLYRAPFVMEVRARQDELRELGQHFTVFLHNDQPYCRQPGVESDIAEFDTVELYSSPARVYDDRATHIGCNGPASANYNSDKHSVDTDVAGGWHTFKTEFDGKYIRYYLDGKPMPITKSKNPKLLGLYASDHTSFGLSAEDFTRKTMDYPYRVAINSDMFPVNTAWNPQMDPTKPFKTRVDMIDYIRIYSMTSDEVAKSRAWGDAERLPKNPGSVTGSTRVGVNSYLWARTDIGWGWNSKSHTAVFNAGDLDGNGFEDMLLTDVRGDLWFYPTTSDTRFKPRVKVGWGWYNMTRIFGGVDFNGDHRVDILGIDKAGTLYLYPGRGNGTFAAKRVIGTGWSGVQNISVTQRGFNGNPVIMGSVNGVLKAWQTDGKARFVQTLTYGSGWNSVKLTAITGDVTGDGIPDMWVVAKDGALRLYAPKDASARGFWIYTLGSGWQDVKYFLPMATRPRVVRAIFPDGKLRQYTLLRFEPGNKK